MKGSSAAIFAAAIVGNVAAYPQLGEKLSLDKRQAVNAWIPAGPGDARSPCPGTNTLANHGFINRDGRGVSAQQYQQGFLDAFGLDFAITANGAQNAINLQNNGQGTFDLDTMNQPHSIEHDGSLTRNDLQMTWNQNADNHDFNATVWCETKEMLGGATHVDPVAAQTVRMGRFAQARMEDFPGWFVENDGGSLAEAGFYLTTMDDPAVDGTAARLDWLNYWFTNERLPTELGWVKPAVSNDHYNDVVNAVSGATPTMTPTGLGSCGAPATSTTPTPPITTPTGGAPYSNSTIPSPKPSVTPCFPDVPAPVASAAKQQATGLAGPAPQVPNAYTTPLSKDQWCTVQDIITDYVTKVESIILSLVGLHSTGSVAMPGVPGSGSSSGGAPWYASMSSSPLAPAATCACT